MPLDAFFIKKNSNYHYKLYHLKYIEVETFHRNVSLQSCGLMKKAVKT